MIINKKLKFLAVFGCVLAVIIFILSSFRFSFVVDESSFLLNVLYFALTKNIVPIYAQYPTFFSYLTAIPIYFGYLVFYFWHGGAVEWLADKSFFTIFFLEHQLIWSWVARSVVMLFSVFTILLTLRLALRYYGVRTAVWTGIILVLDPWGKYMVLSGFGLPDIPMTFFATLVLALAFAYVDKKDINLLYIGAFICGLAASTKLNGIFAIGPVIAACFLGEKEITRKLLTIVSLCVLGFVAGSPALLVARGAYQYGFSIEKDILAGQGHSFAPERGLWAIRWLWQHNALFTIVLFFTVGYSLMRRTAKDILFLSLVIPAFLVLGALRKMSIDYSVFLFPVIALWMSRFLNDLAEAIKIAPYRKIIPVFVSLVLVVGLSWNVSLRLWDRLRPNNIILAEAWASEHIPESRTVRLYKSMVLDCDEILAILGPSIFPEDQWLSHYYQKVRCPGGGPNRTQSGRSEEASGRYYLLTTHEGASWIFPFKDIIALDRNRPGDEILLRNQELLEGIYANKKNARLIKEFIASSGPVAEIYEVKK